MTNEQIFKKAIEKAVKNGWKNPHENTVWLQFYYNDIFSHDFAKAFWGERYEWLYGKEYDKEMEKMLKETNEKQDWQYHLQQMVLEKEPLQYLKKFL